MAGERTLRLSALCLPAGVVLAVCAIVAWAARSPIDTTRVGLPGATPHIAGLPAAAPAEADIALAVGEADRWFERAWRSADVKPAEPADELAVLRRLTLSLCGTIPSLEEIRAFEADGRPGRLDRWTSRLLSDGRFSDYFAERLARSFVGTDEGQVIVYRRDRFVDWLRQQLARNTPYDAIVRQVVSDTGLWTDHPATNFVTVALADGKLDENQLAGRTVRAFLGQRIDCAQCHDHFFAPWKQSQFQGLAALFGQTDVFLFGVEDEAAKTYTVEDKKTLAKRVVGPAVPFHPEWLPASGTRRQGLAAWITHPQNRRFERAAANRVWGLLFGRPFHSPVDDLPDPSEEMSDDAHRDLLDVVGADFRGHGCDLRRMIRVIAASRPFRLESAQLDSSSHPAEDAAAGGAEGWSSFPMTRLRPEQLIGSILQSTSVRTIDQNSHLFVRAQRYFGERDFVKEYGDLGENELDERASTIAQALLRMNGSMAADAIAVGPLSASGRIAAFSGDGSTCLEVLYLVALSRRPSPDEAAYFLPQLTAATEKNARSETVEDLFWSLVNSAEFSWNH